MFCFLFAAACLFRKQHEKEVKKNPPRIHSWQTEQGMSVGLLPRLKLSYVPLGAEGQEPFWADFKANI